MPGARRDVGVGERHLLEELLGLGAGERLEDPGVGPGEPLPPERGVGVEHLVELVEAEHLPAFAQELPGVGEEGLVIRLVVGGRLQRHRGRFELLAEGSAEADERGSREQ